MWDLPAEVRGTASAAIRTNWFLFEVGEVLLRFTEEDRVTLDLDDPDAVTVVCGCTWWNVQL